MFLSEPALAGLLDQKDSSIPQHASDNICLHIIWHTNNDGAVNSARRAFFRSSA